MKMKNFSNQYLKSTERVKSSDENIFEDKDERIKRREERKRERQEKGFEDSNSDDTYSESTGEGKFSLKSFQKAVEGIKNETISQLRDCDVQIKMNGAGKKSAEENHPKFKSILERVGKLLGEIAYRREKEGRKLEADDENDAKLIKAYREAYKSILGDLNDTTKSYVSQSAEATQGYYEDQKYSDITNKIADAEKTFADAKKMMSDNLTDIGIELMNSDSPGGSTAAIATATTSGTGTGKVSDIKIEKPIKKGVGSKSKPDETVKKVQNLIYNKFKNKEIVTKTQQWKAFNKYGADGAFGNATGNLIVLLKSGFSMDDKTSDITQSFVDELNSLKDTLKESKIVLNYEQFLKLNEEWSDDAFIKAAEKTHIEQPSTLNKKEEKKSEEKAKKEDTKGEKVDTKEEDEVKEGADSKEVEDLLIKASDAIVALFKNTSFWEEYKGTIDDKEEEASEEFSKWFNTNFTKKYLKPAEEKSAKIKDSDDKEMLQKNIKTLKDAGPKLVAKILGNTKDDNFYWKIYLLDGTIKSYKVDTDF